MTDDSDWQAAYRAVLEEGRRRLGGPPPDAELAAWLSGTLSPKEKERIEELLTYYPEIAHALAEEEPPPRDAQTGGDSMSEHELARNWASLQSKIRGIAAPDVTVATAPPRSRAAWYVAVAAMVAIALATAVFLPRYRQLQSDVQRLTRALAERPTVDEKDLRPNGVRGAELKPVEISPQADYLLLRLALPGDAHYPEYRVEIVTTEGAPSTIWSASGLERRANNTVEIILPRGFLKPGGYTITVSGVEAAETRLLASYTIRR